jgi:hypothetical protein
VSAPQERTVHQEEAAMSGGSDPRWDDARDRDDNSRDVEIHWIELGRGPGSDGQSQDDARDRDGDRAYLRAEERLREQGGEVRRVVLEQDLKTEYQRFLQDHNRGRSDSDGRPDRDPHEVEAWARDHELPYFDGSVHILDFRIEYELDGRDCHEDIEEHYRGAHAGSRVQAGFSCYGGRSGGGGRPFDPRVADEFYELIEPA